MNYLWILVQIISPVSGFLYMVTLSKWRFSRRTVFAVSAIYIAAITIVNFLAVRDLSYMLDGYPAMDFVYRISNIALAAAVACILVKQPVKQTVFVILTACVCIMIVDSFAITFRVTIGHAIELIWELLLYSFMLFAILKLRMHFLTTLAHMQKNLWILCLLPISLLLCFFLQISIPVPLERDMSNIPVALALCTVAITMYCFLIFLFKALHLHSEMSHNTKVMRIYVSALENQNELIDQTAKNIAVFRHDLRHISKMLSASAKQGDMDGVLELLEHLDKNMDEEAGLFSSVTITGHKLLDITLGFYINLARNEGIETSVDIRDIDCLKADSTELAVALSNALENAFHACQKQPEGEKRCIRIVGHRSGNQFFLGIDNTFFGEIDFDANTGLPVSNEEGHGIGTKSIAFFAEKHNAHLQYNAVNGWFQLRLLF